MEPVEVEGLTDGRTRDGTFVRIFWTWDSDSPGETMARARIAGTEHTRLFGLEEFTRMLPHPPPEGNEHETNVDIGPHSVAVPSRYLCVHLQCVLDGIKLMKSDPPD